MGALMAGRDLTLVGSFPAALVAGLAPGSCFGEVPGLAAPGGWCLVFCGTQRETIPVQCIARPSGRRAWRRTRRKQKRRKVSDWSVRKSLGPQWLNSLCQPQQKRHKRRNQLRSPGRLSIIQLRKKGAARKSLGIIPSNSSIIHCGDVAEHNKQHQATQATHLVLKVVLQQTGWLLSTFEVLIGVEELANGFRELKHLARVLHQEHPEELVLLVLSTRERVDECCPAYPHIRWELSRVILPFLKWLPFPNFSITSSVRTQISVAHKLCRSSHFGLPMTCGPVPCWPLQALINHIPPSSWFDRMVHVVFRSQIMVSISMDFINQRSQAGSLPPNSWEYVHGFWNWECGVRHRLLESLRIS